MLGTCMSLYQFFTNTNIKSFKSFHEDWLVKPEEEKNSKHHGINDTKKGRENPKVYVVKEEAVTENVEKTPVIN